MSSAITGRRLGALAAALAAGAAIGAPAALAADVPVASGTTDLHLNAATAGVLTDAGLSVAPVGPATAKGLRVAFPITGGAIDPATAVGRVTHSGGLAFSSHGTTVRLTNFIVNTAASRPVLTAAVGSARIPLAGIDLSKRHGHPPRLRRHRHLGRPGAGQPDAGGRRGPQRRVRHRPAGRRQHRPGGPQGPALAGAPDGRRHHARPRRRHGRRRSRRWA